MNSARGHLGDSVESLPNFTLGDTWHEWTEWSTGYSLAKLACTKAGVSE
jgi:hypothetical protein